MKRALHVALGFATAITPLPAQASQPVSPSDAEVRAMLRSDDPAKVAWGARHVADRRDRAAVRDLIRVVDRCAREPGFEWRLAAHSAVDALVQSGVKVPEDRLRAEWQDRFQHAALLALACRDPGGWARALRERIEGEHDRAWVAACNLLMRVTPDWLAERLVAETTVHVSIAVTEDGAKPIAGIACCLGTRVRSSQVPKGFPPNAIHDLCVDLAPRSPLGFAVGTGRRLTPTFDVDHTKIDGAQYALICLSYLADAPGATRVRPEETIHHVWRDDATWESDLDARLAGIGQRWRGLLDRLVARRLITPAAARDAASRIGVTVSDERRDRSHELPPVPEDALVRPAPDSRPGRPPR